MELNLETLVGDLTAQGLSPEEISEVVLSRYERDTEYPCYTEKELARKGRREQTSDYLAIENAPSGQVISQVRSAIEYLAQNSMLTPLEVALLRLRVDGYLVSEIADVMRMEKRTVERRLARIRQVIEETTTPEWWRSLHEVTIYHKPSLCCNPGKEECKRDGHCPYGRMRTVA